MQFALTLLICRLGHIYVAIPCNGHVAMYVCNFLGDSTSNVPIIAGAAIGGIIVVIIIVLILLIIIFCFQRRKSMYA